MTAADGRKGAKAPSEDGGANESDFSSLYLEYLSPSLWLSACACPSRPLFARAFACFWAVLFLKTLSALLFARAEHRKVPEEGATKLRPQPGEHGLVLRRPAR